MFQLTNCHRKPTTVPDMPLNFWELGKKFRIPEQAEYVIFISEGKFHRNKFQLSDPGELAAKMNTKLMLYITDLFTKNFVSCDGSNL